MVVISIGLIICSCLAAEYGVCTATISNWIRTYREECQTNDAARSELELMQEVRRLRQELAESKKENEFKKEQRYSLRTKSVSGMSIHRSISKSVRFTLVIKTNENISKRILQYFKAELIFDNYVYGVDYTK